MSGGFPLFGSLANPSSSGAAATTVTSSGSTNTKGSWTQLIASTASDAAALMITWDGAYFNLGTTSNSIDIGIGAAGSETIIVADLISFRDATQFESFPHSLILLPILIPAGSRLSARSQASRATVACNVQIAIYNGSYAFAAGASAVDAIGFSSSTTLGTAVTPVAGSKGSYAQLIASTSNDYAGFFFILDNQNSTGTPQYSPAFDIAVGGAGSETIIAADVLFTFSPVAGSAGDLIGQTVSPIIWAPIVAGSRISTRAQIDTTAAAIGVTLYGIRQ